MASSPLPAVYVGKSLKRIAEENRAAAADANERLEASRTWYEKLKDRFAGK